MCRLAFQSCCLLLSVFTQITFGQLCKDGFSSFAGQVLHNGDTSQNKSCSPMCTEDLGCIQPVNGCLAVIFGRCNSPESVDKIDVQFLFFDQKHIHSPHIVDYRIADEDIKSAPFDPNRLTMIMSHGFQAEYAENDTLGPEKNLLLSKSSDLNIIAINWRNGSMMKNYQQAKANAKVVGAQVALLVQKLSKFFKLNLTQVQLVGHSLGTQVVAFAAAGIQKRLEVKVSRILGLDPAGPCFDGRGSCEKDPEALNPNHAHLVEIVHTNAAKLGWGYVGHTGHYDYYPNGGHHQPGCVTKEVIVSLGFEMSYCSHLRKQALFETDYQAYGECQPIAYNCSSWANFLAGRCASCENNQCQLMSFSIQVSNMVSFPSIPVSGGERLQLYLQTTKKSPFCMFHYQIKAFVKKSLKLSPLRLIISAQNISKVIRLVSNKDETDTLTGLLTIDQTETKGKNPGPFVFAELDEVVFVGDTLVSILNRIQINYMSDLLEATRLRFSTTLCPLPDKLTEFKVC